MACPECGFDHPNLAKYAGKTLKCPKCGVAFKAIAESPLELAEAPPPPPRPAAGANVPSPAVPMQPQVYATTARRAAGLGPAKVATGGIGGLIALVLLSLRISNGCDRVGGETCVRFNDQVVSGVKPVEQGLKGIELAVERAPAEGGEEDIQKVLRSVQALIATGRSKLAGINAPSRKGAPEFLQAARDYVEAADRVVGTILAGKYDSAAIQALGTARDRVRSSQKYFMDQNGLVETR